MKQHKIKNLTDFGQSVWLDFFDREIMDSGKLEKLISEDGVSGVTSNPSIFEKAISSSPDYDKDIVEMSAKKSSSEKIFYSFAVRDIQRAADIFRPIYEKTKGSDGFVSLEVSPRLGHDTEGTISQARELWSAVNRKNVMIKIPATGEGLAAIRSCISEGINVNITLLFGLPRYRAVTEAYLSGLEDRLKSNKPIDEITSVASFFLSRIDVLIDPMLEEKKLADIKGEVAIASAKKAYQMYKEIFSDARFQQLEAKGAKKQHVLWASTSAKDPSFSDVKYVEALIGKETINTLPLETIEAFNDHGDAADRLSDGLDKANAVFAELEKNNISIDEITQKLEDEGLAKFEKAYNALLKTIETKTYKEYERSL